MFRQNQCHVPICPHLGMKSINVSNALKLAERFQVSDDGPSSAQRQRVDPAVEQKEAKIKELLRKIKQFHHLGQDFTEDDIIKVLNYLLLRDYPNIFNLTDHAYLLKTYQECQPSQCLTNPNCINPEWQTASYLRKGSYLLRR